MAQTTPGAPAPIYLHRTERAEEQCAQPLRRSVDIAAATAILARHGRADLAGPLHEGLTSFQAKRLGEKIQRFVEKAGRHSGLFQRYRPHPMPESHQRTLITVAGWLRDVGRAGCETFMPDVNAPALTIAPPLSVDQAPVVPQGPRVAVVRRARPRVTGTPVPARAGDGPAMDEATSGATLPATTIADTDASVVVMGEETPSVADEGHVGEGHAETAVVPSESDRDQIRARNAEELAVIMEGIDVVAPGPSEALAQAEPLATSDDDLEGPASPPWVNAGAYGSETATGTDG